MKKKQIIDAAYTMFLKHGFGISMDLIAKEASVSKQTVYNNFRNKEALFSGIVHDKCLSFKEPYVAQEKADALGFDSYLLEFSENYLTRLFEAETIALYRLVVSESSRFPKLATLFHDEVLASASKQLERFFVKANKAGGFYFKDAAMATDQFCGLIKGQLFMRVVLGVDSPPGQTRIADSAKSAVDIFLHGNNKPKFWSA